MAEQSVRTRDPIVKNWKHLAIAIVIGIGAGVAFFLPAANDALDRLMESQSDWSDRFIGWLEGWF